MESKSNKESAKVFPAEQLGNHSHCTLDGHHHAHPIICSTRTIKPQADTHPSWVDRIKSYFGFDTSLHR